MPPNASAHGAALDAHLLLNIWIALALFALAHVILFAGLALKCRAETRRQALVEYLPLAAITVLFAVLTLRAERLWAATRYVGPDPSALQVEATGMQFAWYFRYPGADAAFGRTASASLSRPAKAIRSASIPPITHSAPTTSSPPSSSFLPAAKSTCASTRRTSSTAFQRPRPAFEAERRSRAKYPHPLHARRRPGNLRDPLHPALRPRPLPHDRQPPRRLSPSDYAAWLKEKGAP